MALPLAANTTADLYHDGALPPSSPDLAGLSIHLSGDFTRYLEAGEGETNWAYSHVALLAPDVDVRDPYDAGSLTVGVQDHLVVPDQNGTQFLVVFVERVGRGTALDHKRVYLDRYSVSWPSEDF